MDYLTAADLAEDQKHVLQIVANLLKSFKIVIPDGSRFYQDTLDALEALPTDTKLELEELASWVFDADIQEDKELAAGKSTYNWRSKYPWKRDKTWKQVVSELARGTSA